MFWTVAPRERHVSKKTGCKKPLTSCTGFSYNAPRLFNKLPVEIMRIEKSSLFKNEVKKWIWNNIPSY